jgi:hypothetical protein
MEIVNALEFFLSVILCSTQLQAFDMNVTHDDMLRVEYGHLIGELLIGDRAYVSTTYFCSKNDQLFLLKNRLTSQKNGYGITMSFEVVPNNMVSITLETDYKKYLDEVSYVIPDTIHSIITKQYIPNLEFFAVKSIHGHENMRDYIGFLKEAGFELKADLN